MIFIDPNQDPVQRKAQLIKLAEILESFIRHPGFEIWDEYNKQEEVNAFEALTKCTTGDIAMKASGAYTAIKRMRELPRSYLKTTLEQLKLL